MIIKKQRIVFAYIVTEFLLLNISYLFFLIKLFDYPNYWTLGNPKFPGAFFYLLLTNLSWMVVVAIRNTQDFYLGENHLKRSKMLLINVLGFLGIFSFLILILGVKGFDRDLLIYPLILFSFFNLLFNIIVANRFQHIRHEKGFGSNLLILGDSKSGKEVWDFSQQNKHLGYGVLGFVVEELESNNKGKKDPRILGKASDLGEILDREPVHELVIALPQEKDGLIRKAIDEANFRGIRISMVQQLPEWMGHNFKDYHLGGLNIMQLRQTPLDDFKKFLLKKVFDIVFSLSVLLLLSPVYLLISALIVIESGFPIFYTPMRKREAGMTFRCFKFRTMRESDDPNTGTRSTVKNDPRLTKVGKFLRKVDLDELPQFLNVLKGEMSVVGPRPHRVHLKQEFRNVVQDYMIRHYVKPGITGWAQVNGWRGPTETVEQKEERIKHDLWYIENWTFLLDLKIIFLTVFGRKSRKNAF